MLWVCPETWWHAVTCPTRGLPLQLIAASLLHWRVGSSRSFAANRTEAKLSCRFFLRNGEVLAYVGLPQNLKALKGSRGHTVEYDGTTHLTRANVPHVINSRDSCGAVTSKLLSEIEGGRNPRTRMFLELRGGGIIVLHRVDPRSAFHKPTTILIKSLNRVIRTFVKMS